MVEICLDEMTPLVKQDLLRPIDPKGITDWDDLDFTEAEGIVLDGQDLRGAALGRPRGRDLQHEEVPGGIDEIADVFDPAVRRALDDPRQLRAAADRRGALAMGIEDPFAMDSSSSSRRSST